jgi:membrane protease YdiL (CAAX protease family)
MTNGHATRNALTVLACHNLVQNYLLNERGYVTGNLAVSGLLVGMGRTAGLGWDEMGLHPARFRRGLRMGAWASAGAATAALLALGFPGIRILLEDERAAPTSGGPVWRRALVRFPLGTALFEEVAFRGVIPALLRRDHRPLAAETRSAGFFALWHLIPTYRALAGNPLGKDMSAGRRVAAGAAGAAAAGGFGLVFSAMRRHSGTLVAPWLAHASLNTLSYLAGVTAWKLRNAGDYRRGGS